MNWHKRTLFLSLLFTFNALALANGDGAKFAAARGPEPVIGHYLVTLVSSVNSELSAATAEALARAYEGQREPFASSDVRQFAITMLPGRARTLSSDPRVLEVVEIAQPDQTAVPPPSSSAAANLTRQHLVPIAQDSTTSGTYLYDGSGNIKLIGTDSFTYDSVGRLKVAIVQGNQQSYNYDAFGNRTSATRATNAVGCAGGTACEATVTVLGQSNHLAEQTYDDAGNVKTGFGATYTYDGTGMVTSAVVGSDIRDFAYTAEDERIAVRQGLSWTWTVRDQNNKVLREFTSLEAASSPLALSRHTWSKDYIWRDGQLLAAVSQTASGPTTYHYHLDHLGTPRLITGTGGVLIAKHAYYPFGAEMAVTPTETTAELMKFTGHERDLVAGDNHSVDYMHARFYNANLGRFLAVDTAPGAIDEPQSWNRYRYASDNPLMRFDPDGLRDVYVAIWNARLPYFGRGSVGHTGAFELDGRAILSQFPQGIGGRNATLGYDDTLQKEKRLPDNVFKVFVPDDQQFDSTAVVKKSTAYWNILPEQGCSTNCVDAVGRALDAGGVPIRQQTNQQNQSQFPTTPGDLNDRLSQLQNVSGNGTWSVQSVPVDVLGKPSTPPNASWTALQMLLAYWSLF
jgi:RHS repeat-associated protein